MAFLFHAKATAFGATFTQPACEVIPSQASVSLAATGGQGYDRVERFNWRNVVTFDEATAYVSGTINNGKAETLATTRITNLNILNAVSARSITASVNTVNILGSGMESKVYFNASFEDLRIDGVLVEPVFDEPLFRDNPTYEEFKNGCGHDLNNIGKRYGWQETARTHAMNVKASLTKEGKTPPAEIENACNSDILERVPEIHGAIRASLVADCRGGSSRCSRKNGYGLAVPGFGTIYLAEVILRPGHRRLSMLRLDLGSPTIGNGTSNDVEGNGTDIPP